MPYGERIFDQHMGDLVIRGVTIQNGNTPALAFPANAGGGIRSRTAGDLQILQTRFYNNRAVGNGGGLYFSSSSRVLVLTSCNFEMNVSLDFGGGAALFGSSGTSHEITDCRFYSNQATNQGGGIYLSATNGISTVQTTIVENNMTLSSSGGGISFSSTDGTLFLSKSTISGNSSSLDAGGIYLNATRGNHYLDGVTVNNNMAGDQGGGIAAHGSSGLFVFTNCTISANRANSDGGGVSIGTSSGQELNLNFVTITQNTADDDNAGGGDGGGFHIFSSSTINIHNSIIQGNTDNSPGNHDCSNSGVGTINSLGGNVFGFDADCMTGPNDTNLPANLSPLQNNGGPTKTHAISTNSAAYNFAACDTIDMDQRMFFRIDGECDSGAYEFGASTEPIPALGQWGLILLGLILIIIGTVALRQRAAHSC